MTKYLILLLLFNCHKPTRVLDSCRKLKSCESDCETYQHEHVKDYYGRVHYAPVVDDKGGNVRC